MNYALDCHQSRGNIGPPIIDPYLQKIVLDSGIKSKYIPFDRYLGNESVCIFPIGPAWVIQLNKFISYQIYNNEIFNLNPDVFDDINWR